MEYEIIDGVRRAKAAQLAGHRVIRARLYDLRSPHKKSIRRATQADEIRWRRAEAGARQAVSPFPPIDVCVGGRGIRVQDITFDFGRTP